MFDPSNLFVLRLCLVYIPISRFVCTHLCLEPCNSLRDTWFILIIPLLATAKIIYLRNKTLTGEKLLVIFLMRKQVLNKGHQSYFLHKTKDNRTQVGLNFLLFFLSWRFPIQSRQLLWRICFAVWRTISSHYREPHTSILFATFFFFQHRFIFLVVTTRSFVLLALSPVF